MNTYDKMKEDLREHGHFKGDFYANKNEPYTSAACLMGSMHRVLGTVKARFKYHPKACGPLEDVIAEQFPDRLAKAGVCTIPEFNDHDATTLSDIILVLEKAAIKEDERV